jgi:hypothetical protein
MDFKSLRDAVTAGWRRVNRRTDKDVSGYGYFGYEFESPDGERSQKVFYKNERGDLKFQPMYPPSKED